MMERTKREETKRASGVARGREQTRAGHPTRCVTAFVCLIAAAVWAAPVWAANPGEAKTATDKSRGPQSGAAETTVDARAAAKADAPPIIAYVPKLGRGGARATAGAGTRALSGSRIAVEVLAPPDHIALTTKRQPTLYWFVSEATDQRIDFTLNDEESIEPLLEVTLPGPVEAGIHALDLSEHGIQLAEDETYTWFVTLVENEQRRSGDRIAQGLIEWTPVSDELERSLEGAKWSYAPYALSGIWYDAVHELLQALEKEPMNKRLRLQRSALLEQAELAQVALHSLHADR